MNQNYIYILKTTVPVSKYTTLAEWQGFSSENLKITPK